MTGVAGTPAGAAAGASWTVGILAGGFSRRLGVDKATIALPCGGTPIDLLARVHGAGVRPVLVATRPGGPAADGRWPVVFDPEPGQGPLGGLVALLSACGDGSLLALACDALLWPEDLGSRLAHRLRPGSAGLVLGTPRGPEPFPAILTKAALPALAAAYATGRRRADAWIAPSGAQVIPFREVWPEPGAEGFLRDLDDPDDRSFVFARLGPGPLR